MLQDYHDGIISDTLLQHRLNFMSWSEDRAQQSKNANVSAKLELYIETAAKSPEEIMIEQEEYAEIICLIEEIKRILTDSQYNVFFHRHVRGLNTTNTAQCLGISKATVSVTEKRALENIREHFKNRTDIAELLHAKPSMLVAGTPQHKIRYPSEFLSKTYTGGRKGKRRWICYTRCDTGKYIDESFGDDCTVCNMCEKCKNETMKERCISVKISK